MLDILEEQGVNMRGQGIPEDRLGEVSELYRSGLSLMWIGKKFDCSAETVRRTLLGPVSRSAGSGNAGHCEQVGDRRYLSEHSMAKINPTSDTGNVAPIRDGD